MTYREAVGRLLALRGGEHAGMQPGLARIEGLLQALGHPEERFVIAQVAGTNGKGSVSAMLATILKSAGRRVGLYTSPHLISFRERIRVDGAAIPEDDVADGVDALGTLIARFDATMFEAATALALDHFTREHVDVAVLEVGLGGRLDATTVGRPAVAVVTPIDFDHEAYLGTTLAQIAGEKAAIIRSGIAISAAQKPEAADVILRRAEATGVPLLLEGRDLHVNVERRDLAGQTLTCAGPGWTYEHLLVPLLGVYQPTNTLLAVTAARELGVDEAAIRAGIARVQWPGRFQVIGAGPWTVLDGAHNPAGARVLAASLRDAFGDRPMTLIVGALRDKNVRTMLEILTPLAERVILTQSSNPRAHAATDLQALLPETTAHVELAPSIGEALTLAARPPRTPVTCVTGSLSLVGDALASLGGGMDTPCSIERGAASLGSGTAATAK